MRWMWLGALALASPVGAVECRDVRFDDTSFTICEVDPSTEDLRLFHADDEGAPLGSFAAVESAIDAELSFAMNAGMYHPDRSPVGLYIEDGEVTRRAVPNAGPGNFGLLPNGILCINDTDASVWETLTYLDEEPSCEYATQSGPMLVIDGAVHPRFIPGGTSRYIRNGVGVREDGTTVFAISNQSVNFDTFGRLFRDELETPNALFLDGKVSRLYAPDHGRRDFGFTALGPIVGVVAP